VNTASLARLWRRSADAVAVRSAVHTAAVAGILAVAAIVRFVRLGPGFYDDEAYSVEVARHNLGGIVRLLERTDTHPPLSYVLVHVWMQIFGSSEAAVRTLSAAWGLGTVLVIYLLGRLLWSREVGLIAALLLALSQYNVFYAHYARMYTMMGFFAALSFYFLARLYKGPTRRVAIWYVLASATLMYTHVWGVFLVLSQTAVVIAVVALRRSAEPMRLLKRWLLLQGTLLAIWAPWLATGFRHQIQTTLHENSLPYGNLADYHPPGAHAVANAAYVAANRHSIGLVFVLIVGAALVTAAVRARRSGPAAETSANPRNRAGFVEGGLADPRLVMVAAWYLVPLSIGVVASYAITPVFLQRYVIGTTLPVFLIVAFAITRLPNKAVAGIALVLAVGFSARTVESYVSSLHDFFRAPPEFIRTHAEPGDVVLYDEPAIVFDYYAEREDIHGTHVRQNQLDLSFITLLRNRRDAIDPTLRNPYTKDSLTQDLHALDNAAKYKRVWLVLEPKSHGQLPTSMAVHRLERSFGAPKRTLRVGSFDVFFFERSA
jgi:mannosyltransferase